MATVALKAGGARCLVTTQAPGRSKEPGDQVGLGCNCSRLQPGFLNTPNRMVAVRRNGFLSGPPAVQRSKERPSLSLQNVPKASTGAGGPGREEDPDEEMASWQVLSLVGFSCLCAVLGFLVLLARP